MREPSPHDGDAQYIVSGQLLRDLWSQLQHDYEDACSGGQDIIDEMLAKMANAPTVPAWKKLRDRVYSRYPKKKD